MELVDLSCADEVVAKLLLAEPATPTSFLVLRGLREDQHEAIEHVLTHHRLAVAATPSRRRGAPPAGLGQRRRARGLRHVHLRHGPLAVRELAAALGGRKARARDALEALVAHRLVRADGRASTARSARHEPPAVRPLHHRHPRHPAPPPRLDSGRPAIIQSSTFTNPVGSDEEVLYTRYGNNPNQVALAAKYALLEGTEEAIFVRQRHGRDRAGHLAVLRPGDHLDQQQLDLRRHPAALRRGAGPARDRR